MRRNSLEASAIARPPRCFVVSPRLINREQHQARGGLVVKDQAAHQLGPWSVQNVRQSGRTNDVIRHNYQCPRCRHHSPRPCPSQPT